MKTVLSLLLFSSINCLAQLNKDEPLTIGTSDKIFKSSADPKVAYLIPIKLETLAPPVIDEVDGEYRIFFDVGVNPKDLSLANDSVASMKMPFKVRVMHVQRAEFDPMGPQQIEKRFKPRLTSLGDTGDLNGPVPYVLSIRKIGRKLGAESKKAIDRVFHGDHAAHLGTFYYEFNAVSGGIHYFAKTGISIFAVDKSVAKITAAVDDDKKAVDFKYDRVSHCWDKPEVGVICLK